jgi:ferrous-iron efflux pump FieF
VTIPSEQPETEGIGGTNGKLMRSATYASVTVALILIGIKMVAYFATNSVAVLSTLVDSILDLGASIINLIAVRQALVPADRDHRFGHGKAEALAGLFQSAVILGSGVFLVFQSFERLVNPKPVQSTDIGITIMVMSILLTILLVAYQRYVIHKTRSIAISADSLHYAGDLLINGSVIVALLVSAYFDWHYADALFAIGIAVFLLFSSWSIIRKSMSDLMDEELADEERQNIIGIAIQQPGVLGVHDLRTRRSGQQVFIQMHLDIDGNMSLQEAHDISDSVEMRLMDEYPDSEAIVHQDPVRVQPPPSTG